MRQKFGNILVWTSLQWVYHVTESVQAMDGTCCGYQYCDDVLTSYGLLHSVCDLKVAKMNMQHSLIQSWLDHDTVEATKNIYFTKGEDTFDRYTWWFRDWILFYFMRLIQWMHKGKCNGHWHGNWNWQAVFKFLSNLFMFTLLKCSCERHESISSHALYMGKILGKLGSLVWEVTNLGKEKIWIETFN